MARGTRITPRKQQVGDVGLIKVVSEFLSGTPNAFCGYQNEDSESTFINPTMLGQHFDPF